MEITEGVARINASYNLKLPTPDVEYGSESPNVSITIEVPIEGELDAFKERLLEIEADLMTEVKLAVFAQLDVEPKELPSGVIAPDLSRFGKGKSSSTKRQGNRSSSGRGGKSRSGSGTSRRGTGSRRGSNGSSKVDKSGLPRVELEFWNKFEEEMQDGTFIDQRSLKEDGTYKPGAADFVQEDGSYQLWVHSPQGDLNEDTADALDAAGIDY